LETFLKTFKKRKYKEQKLMIDIKDYGYEKEHIKIVNKYELKNNIIWVSWLPQSILKLEEIEPTMTKFLSYIPINFYLKIKKIPLTRFVIIKEDKYKEDLKKYKIGFQHAYFSNDLPKKFIKILSKNNGGVCIHKSLLTKYLLNKNQKNNIKTAIFSIKNKKEFIYFNNKKIDILFCDFAI